MKPVRLFKFRADVCPGFDFNHPDRGKVRLAPYAGPWIDERAGLRPRTRELYRWLSSGTESPNERPALSMEQVGALADLMPERQRTLVMVATFASLRYGEVTALRRMDIDRARGTVSVRRAFTEVRGQGMVLGPPKSRAGLRTVALPGALVAQLAAHLTEFVPPEPTALVFNGPKGAPIRRSNFNPLVGWLKAVEAIGAPGLHFHDLRHTGNTLAAATGVSTRDLMARMGHDSMNAAIVYQHATREADHVIADALDAGMRALREAATKATLGTDAGNRRGLESTR